MKALKPLFDFAFNRETIDIIKDLRDLRETAVYSWENQKYITSILIWIILSIMAIGTTIVAAFEYVLGFAILIVRGVVLFSLGLIAELLSLGIKR